MAVVGGANIIFHPDIFILMSSFGLEARLAYGEPTFLTEPNFLSPDGRSLRVR